MASKIGIVTYVFTTNFGAALQQYGLQFTLKTLGYEVETLKFNPSSDHERDYQRFPEVFQARRRSAIASRAVKKLKRRLARLGGKCLDKLVDNAQKARKFDQFNAQFLSGSPILTSYRSLEEYAARFDAVIAGSDQIWNPRGMPSEAFFRYYMLNFVPPQKRLAYAPSLGVSQLESRLEPVYRHYLQDFSWLSTREPQGAQELSRVLQRPVDAVIDPTGLLRRQDWDALINASDPFEFDSQPFVFCYSLRNQEQTLHYAYEAQKILKCPIVFFCGSQTQRLAYRIKNKRVIPLFNAGPCEFLRLLSRASCVTTDSFHASIFSIIMARPVFCVLRDQFDAKRSMNSRVTALFSDFGMQDRLLGHSDATLRESDFQFDYTRAHEILAQKRQDALAKLQRALSVALASHK